MKRLFLLCYWHKTHFAKEVFIIEAYCTTLDWDRIFEYICQRLMADGFQKKGKLLIRRCGVIITTVYYDRSWPNREDFSINSLTIWNFRLKWADIRYNNMLSMRLLFGRMLKGESASPMLPVQENGKYPVDAFKKYKYADPGSPICWDEFQDMLERTLFSAVSYLSSYEGYKENLCYRPTPGSYLRTGEWAPAMYERNLEWLSFLADNELQIRSRSPQYPEHMENRLQRHLAIFEAGKAGNWMPAQQYLEELSAPREVLLKKYHIKDYSDSGQGDGSSV